VLDAGEIGGEPFGAVLPPPSGWLPPWERALVAEAARPALTPLSRARLPHDPAAPALIAVVRDEAARLPGWLAHYRRLGVARFAIVDNRSIDATRALLASEPDVDLYATDAAFRAKQAWVNALVARMGYDRWYLHVDADERLVYDGAPGGGRPGRRLAALIRFAEARGLCRLRGMLVDLYPPGPLAAPAPGEPLFDGDGYAEALCLQRVSRKGGPRRRVFGVDPELTKYPLFRLRAGELVSSPHHLHPWSGNYRSDCFLGLLHDKFGPGFRAKARRAAAERNYWQESLEYRATLAALARDPGLALAYRGSRRYRAPADLIAAGLIAPIPWTGRPRLLARLATAWRRGAVARA